MRLLKIILLGLVWTMLTGDMEFGNLLVGLALGYGVLRLQFALLERPPEHGRGRRIVGFLIYMAWEIFRSGLRVAHDVVTPTLHARPGIVAVPLDAKTDVEVTFVMNALTLTPGTVSLDLSEDRKTLFVHALFVDDPDRVRRKIKDGIERRLLEILR